MKKIPPPVFWFYGLAASGKTTLSTLLHEHISGLELDCPVQLLDGDQLRASMPYKFGHTEEYRNMGFNAALNTTYYLRKHNVLCIAATILFTREHRQYIRKILPGVIDIYCNADVETCIQRDPKGIYKNNLSKKKPELVGVDIPFEPPDSPVINLNTNDISVSQSWEILRQKVTELKLAWENRKLIPCHSENRA